jgi:two-component system alkaline phosphatase synthesis response regulator PhoP
MIWLVGEDLNQYRQLLHSFAVQKIPNRQFDRLADVIHNIEQKPEAILIDIDGIEQLSLEFCSIVSHKQYNCKTNILLFSSNTDENVEVSAFEAGANDFILKPFKHTAVLQRIQARLDKLSSTQVLKLILHPTHTLEINKEEFTVQYDGNEITFSKKEFELLFLLASNPGNVFRREEL